MSFFALDAHADTAQRFLDLGEHFDADPSGAEVSLARARAGGLGAQIFSIWVDPGPFPGAAAWPRTQALVAAVRGEIDRRPDALALARTGREVRSLHDRGVFAVLMGVEGAHALGADGTGIDARLARLGELSAAGLRYVSPAWANSNDFAGSSGDAGRGRGLSGAGERLVARCWELGLLVDVSHVSDPTFDDLHALASSTGRPLVASHSSARALANVPRNLTDAQLHAIADSGGVASVNFYPSFLDDDFRARATAATQSPAARAAEEAARRAHPDDPGRASLAAYTAKGAFARQVRPAPTVERVGDHLAHMVNAAGEDHVGLGSDFDGISAVPLGLDDVAALPNLATALARRHMTPRVIEKIFATNWLTVLDL